MRKFFIILTAIAITAVGCRKNAAVHHNTVAVTNTFLAAAVNDLTNCGVGITSLAGPGMCPGHFDIRPAQIDEMRHARVLLRMDFQKSLDGRLKSLVNDGLKISEIKISGGLCQPASYLSACRQIADILVRTGIMEKNAAEKRLAEISKRINATAPKNLSRIAKFKNVPVIASAHQTKFCQWLGLRVIADYAGADTALPGHINQAVIKGCNDDVKIVVANAPEGSKIAAALAERLNAKVVMFDNFPADEKSQTAYDNLISKNVSLLLEVVNDSRSGD